MLTAEAKRTVVRQNIEYFLDSGMGYEISETDREYVRSLNLSIVDRLEKLLGDRFQAVGILSFLVENAAGQEAAVIKTEPIRTTDERISDMVQQIAKEALDDDSLTLFIHTPALPGGLRAAGSLQLDRRFWRSRFTVAEGTLHLPQPFSADTREPAKPPSCLGPMSEGKKEMFFEGTRPLSD